jgi:hypothetical protein
MVQIAMGRLRYYVLLGVILFVAWFSAGCQHPAKLPDLPMFGRSRPSPTITQHETATSAVTHTLIPTPTPTTQPVLPSTPAPAQIFTPASTANYEPTSTGTPQPSDTPIPKSLVFAVIGDYGADNTFERDVANLIFSWQPDFIITVGDNNYPAGAYDTIDAAIGKYFHSYIYPYIGSYGAGAELNRFFPSLGNHDLLTNAGQPYFDYFTLPGNERYYDFTWGPAHFFALNDIESEPDGVGVSSIQANWLQSSLANSNSAWNIVYMHYPPYSSGPHGSTDWARWPYKQWGADVVLAGHDHTYERLEEDGLTYFVNGIGGNGIYDFVDIVEGSQVRYNGDYGAMRVEMTDQRILFQCINIKGVVVDTYEISK